MTKFQNQAPFSWLKNEESRISQNHVLDSTRRARARDRAIKAKAGVVQTRFKSKNEITRVKYHPKSQSTTSCNKSSS